MKKILAPSLFLIVSAILIMILREFFPKYAGMLIFVFIYLLLDGYLWFSVRGPIRKMKPFARAGLTVLFWLPLSLLLCLIAWGFFVPFLTWNLQMRTYVQSFILVLFLAKFFPIVFLLLADITRLGRFIFRVFIPGKRIAFNLIPRYRSILFTGWFAGGFVFVMLVAGMIFWEFDFTIHRQEIRLRELPPSFDGLKIVQFSDVHLGSWGSKKELQEAMKKINGLHPDVIFFTGDMFNYSTADGNGFENILQVLQAPCGIYAIMGNHDYGDYINWPSEAAKRKNMEDLKAFYNKLGWKLLLNSHDILKRGMDSIAVIGVENWGSSARFQRLGDIAKAQKGTETMAIQLLLSHDPSHWDSIISKKYRNIDVTFSGHTHGGQVGIDCCNVHWSPVTWVYRQWCGLYTNPASAVPQYLYVNQGLGSIGYSGRIGIMPEITLIILKREKEK